MIEFNLGTHEYIELNKLLKLLGLVESGAEANRCIDNGEAMVGGMTETRRRNKLPKDSIVNFRGYLIHIVP